jgi:flagellar biosynthetic protein FlhB
VAEDASDGDKTEEPSEKRREDAKAKGSVAISREVNSVGVLVAVALAMSFTWPQIRDGTAGVVRRFLREGVSNPEAFVLDPLGLMLDTVLTVGTMLGPMLVLATLAGGLVVFAQIGVVWSPGAMSPDWSRLDPIAGIKQKFFSEAMVNELLKSLFKVAIVTWVVVDLGREQMDGLQDAARRDLDGTLRWLWSVSWTLVVRVMVAMTFLGLADVAFVRWQHEKKLRMSRQQLKDEAKDQDGNPEIKGKLKRLMQEMSRKRLVADMAKATVIVTNPTHYAVALAYEMGQDGPPKVVARGVEGRAKRIQEIARSKGIPRVENRPLARALYARCKAGQFIPTDLYEGVAEVLAFVYRLRERQRARRKPSGSPTARI